MPRGFARSAFRNGETHLRGRSLMIPEPHRAISSTYTPSKNASTARPGEHRVGRAVTPPRAAVFESFKRRKRRFFAETPASWRARQSASTTKRAVFAHARALGWWRVPRPKVPRGNRGNRDGTVCSSLGGDAMDKTSAMDKTNFDPYLDKTDFDPYLASRTC